MSYDLHTIANTKVFISKNPTSRNTELTPEDFEGTEWIEIGGLYQLGELGGDQQINEYELINEKWMIKSKSTRNGGTMTNVFIPMPLDPGQIKFKEAIDDDCNPYKFKVERGADCARNSVVTIAGDKVTWEDHGFSAGQPIVFSTDGTLPTGLTAGKVYYIISAGLTNNDFSVSETPGGAAVTTTGAGTGDIVATAAPIGMTDMFFGLATDGARSGGSKNDLYTLTWPIAVTGPIVNV